MTTSKIETTISNIYGISNCLDRWVMLFPQISIILLKQDANIFLDKRDYIFIDSANEIVKIGRETTSGSYKTIATFKSDSIIGFVSSVKQGAAGMFYKK